MVGDRESDIFEVFEEADRSGRDFLVQVRNDRHVLFEENLMQLTDAAFCGQELGRVLAGRSPRA